MKKLYSLLVLALVGLLVGSELFAATAPSIQASSIGFSGIGTGPNHVNILCRKGNGAHRAVVFTTEATPASITDVAGWLNTNPVITDGTGDYNNGNSAFITGHGTYKVIDLLDGNARSAALTNLPGSGTIYVIEYNQDITPPTLAYCANTASSNPRTVYYPAAAVSGYASGDLQATKAKLQWTPVSGAAYYTLTISTDADLTDKASFGGMDGIDVGAGNIEGGLETWYVSGLGHNKTFYFGVKAYYANGTSTDLTGPFGTFDTKNPTFTFDTDILSDVTDELEWSIDGGTEFTSVTLGEISDVLAKADREAITAANDIIVRNIETNAWTTTINIVDDLVAPSTTVNFIDETTTDALDNTVEYYVDVNAADDWDVVTGNTCSGSVVSVQPNANGGVSKYFHYRRKGTGLSMPKSSVGALEIPVRPATPTSPTCLIAIATENSVFNFAEGATGIEVQQNTGAWADATISGAQGFMDAPELTIAVNDVVNARVKAVDGISFHSENLTTTAKARPFAPTTAAFTFTPGADQYKLTGVTDAMEYQYDDGGVVWTSVPEAETSVQLDATAETKAAIYVRYKQNCTNSTAISDNQTLTFVAGPEAPAFCAADADGDVLVGLTPSATNLEANIDGGVYYPVDVDASGAGYITDGENMVPFALQTINVRVKGDGLTKSGATTTHVGDSRAAAPAVTAAFAVDGSGVDVLRVSGADATMEYTLEHILTPWISIADANPLDIPLSSINFDLSVRVKCNAGTPPSDEMSFSVLENAAVPTITIADATEDMLYGLPALADGMEARIGTTGEWTALVIDENGISDVSISMPFATGNVIYVRYSPYVDGTDYIKPSASASVTAQDEATAPAVTFTFSGATANQIVSTTTLMEYSLDGGTVWNDCLADATPVVHGNISAANDILVRVKALAPAPYSLTTTFNILAGPGAPSFDLADAARDLLFGLPADQALGVLEANLEATDYSAIETNALGQATFGCNLGDNVHVRYAAHDLTLEGTPATQVAVDPPAFTPDGAGNPDFSFDDYNGMNPWMLINLNTTMEYSVDGGITWTAATGAEEDLTGLTITPALDILVRNEVAPPVAASQNYTIDIIQGAATVAPEIDFANEVLAMTSEREWATNADFDENYGQGVNANILAGAYAIQDAPAGEDVIVYVRDKATYHTTAKTATTVTIPVREEGPTVSIDFENEVTFEEFTSAVEWSDHGLNTWYSPTDPNVEYAEVVPGTDLDFRTKATGTAFLSQITVLDVPARPAATNYTISYVNEWTNEVVPATVEYMEATMVGNKAPASTAGPDSRLHVIAGHDFYFRVASTNEGAGNFYGEEQHLVVKARQAQPSAYTIDFLNESTVQSVPATQEYRDTPAGEWITGTAAPAPLAPTDQWRTLYVRTKAIEVSIDPPVVGEFCSEYITLDYNPRPAAPTANYTVNYLTEMTNEVVSNTLEWSKVADFATKTAGNNAVIEALPSTTYYFRYPATALAFGSLSGSYTTDDRPEAPEFTIDYIEEETNEIPATTIEYGFSNAYGSTGNGVDEIALTPGAAPKTLYARVAAVTGTNYSGTPLELVVPARPVAVGVGINYLTEETTGPFDDTYEWGYTNAYGHMCDGAHNVPLAPGAVAHDFFLRKAASQVTPNFAGFPTAIVIPARPAAPAAHTIDYVTEKTIEAVPATEEYSTDDFETAGTPGTGVAITVTPGTDLYFRVAASEANTNFCSESVMLDVPARPVYNITANDLATFTPRDPKPELEATVNGTGTLYWLTVDGPAIEANVLDEQPCESGVAVGTSLYNGDATTTYYVAFRSSLGGFISEAVDQVVTVYAAPTAATALNFDGAADEGTLDINWTNGDGTNVMIVRQTGNDVTFAPVNGTTYTTGQEIDANTKVIYAGLDDIATITDAAATASTAFAYRAYSYNGVNGAYIYDATTSTYNPWMPLYLTGTATPIAPSTSIESGKSYKLSINPVYRDGSAHTMAALSSRTINVAGTGVGVTASIPATSTLVAGENKKEITTAKITAADGGTDVLVTLADNANGYFVNGDSYEIEVGNVMCAEPTAQATYVVFGTSSCSGPGGTRNIQVKFTMPSTGAGAIVVAKQATSLNEVPVDGEVYGGESDRTVAVSYAAAPAFGSLGAKTMFNFNNAQVQYTSGLPLQMTNLTASSQVRVRVYMYNGSGATTNYYSNAGTFNPRSATLSACRQGENGSVCELSGFRARSSMGSVITNWNVAEENMVVGYTLERAEAIGENPEFAEVTSYVSNNAMAGSLTESANKSYNFVDRSADLRVGKDYLYRLSYTDVNGEKQQLAEDMVTVVNMNTEGDQMLSVNNVRANGSTLDFNLELAQSLGVTVQIVDMTGMSVSTQINGKVYSAGETKVALDIQNLTSGTYFLNVSSANGEAVVEKFVVVK